MKGELKFPETLHEAIKYFADGERAFEYMKSVRWPSGKVSCPRCGCEEVSFISTRKLWTCGKCKTKKQFTIRVGTILEDSAISFDKWICALTSRRFDLTNAKTQTNRQVAIHPPKGFVAEMLPQSLLFETAIW